METIINGIKTNCQVVGEGKPFLILHGWGSNSERWQPVAEIISKKGFKVMIPDLPGFGKSNALPMPWNTNKYVAWIEAFIDSCPEFKDGFYLLGHSFGGALASKLAVKHNQDIKELFLVSAACVRKRTAKKGILAKISKVVKLFNFLPYYDFLRKAVYRFIIKKSDYVYVKGVMRETYMNVIAEDLSFHLPFIKVPTTIIWGDKDEFTPLDEGRFINKQIKKSKLVVIPEAGHDLNRKQPDILAEKVLENI